MPDLTDLEVKVGDEVRSFDYHHRDDCYVEGTVMKIEPAFSDVDRYWIKVKRVVWLGKMVGARLDMATPPVNGTALSRGRVAHFVHLIDCRCSRCVSAQEDF